MSKILKSQYEGEYFDDDISGFSTEELVIVHELVLAKLFDMEHAQKTVEHQLPDEEFRSKQEQLVLLEKRIRKAFACE
jgi:hypothetical protein